MFWLLPFSNHFEMWLLDDTWDRHTSSWKHHTTFAFYHFIIIGKWNMAISFPDMWCCTHICLIFFLYFINMYVCVIDVFVHMYLLFSFVYTTFGFTERLLFLYAYTMFGFAEHLLFTVTYTTFGFAERLSLQVFSQNSTSPNIALLER